MTALAAQTVSAAGETVMPGEIVKVTPDGRVIALWTSQLDGHSVVRAAVRDLSGKWQTPATISAADHDVQHTTGALAPNGDFHVVYTDTTDSTIQAAVLRHGAPTFCGHEPISDQGHNAGHPAIAVDAHSNAVAVWSQNNGTHNVLRLAQRSANPDSSWGPSTVVSPDEATTNASLIVAPNGAVTVTWTHPLDAPQTFIERATTIASADHASGGPAATVDLADGGRTASFLGPVTLAAYPDSSVLAVWGECTQWTITCDHTRVDRRLQASDGTWGTDQLVATDVFTPSVAVNDRGDTLISILDYTTLVGSSVSLPAGSSTWTDPVTTNPFGGDVAATAGLTAVPGGSIYGLSIHTPDFSMITMEIPRWDPDSGWAAAVEIPDSDVYMNDGAAFDADAYGNLAAIFVAPNGNLRVAGGDGAGPALTNISVPSTVTVGDAVSVSAAAHDVWSDTADTSWDFGDGQSATGTSASHAYDAAGTYTVTVTSTDTVGNRSSASRAVTVTAPPEPEPPARPAPPAPRQEKVKLPPVIPALLAGKKITITTSVPNCSAKFVATTTFGTTRYQTKLKLTKNGKLCTATGTIVLKKAPSTRTKLRVAIGRLTKTGTSPVATLTTRRS